MNENAITALISALEGVGINVTNMPIQATKPIVGAMQVYFGIVGDKEMEKAAGQLQSCIEKVAINNQSSTAP
jgi:hypothetical protein